MSHQHGFKRGDKVAVFEEAQQKRLSSGFLMTPEDMMDSPQLEARQFFRELEHPSTGTVKYPGAPFRLSASEWVEARAPLLGEHNREVYAEQFGLSEGDLTRLATQGVI